MWVEIVNNRIVYHSAEPEYNPESTVFFQENIPFEKGILHYDGEKIVVLPFDDSTNAEPVEQMLRNIMDNV